MKLSKKEFDAMQMGWRNGMLQEFESEANRRGFATVKKTSDLGLEGYFRFRKVRK